MDQFDDSTLIPSTPSFESLKNYNQHKIEYWSARNLQPHLGYSQWRRFENAIKKATRGRALTIKKETAIPKEFQKLATGT